MDKYPKINTQKNPLKMESSGSIARIEFDCLARAADQGLPTIEFDEVNDRRCSDTDLVFEAIETDRIPLSALPAVAEH